MTRSPLWSRVDKLVDEHKLEEAFRELDALRASLAPDPSHEAEAAEALMRQAQLRVALHGFGQAIRLLWDAGWPKGLLARTMLELHLGHLLDRYLSAYSWEIRGRERVAGVEPHALEQLTGGELRTQALAAYERVWRLRSELDQAKVESLGELVRPGSYPPGIRDRLRDLVTYLAVELLADDSWEPASEADELYRLDLRALLGSSPTGTEIWALDDGALHPLQRLCAALADLEQWHEGAGRAEAALEARLERLRRLWDAFDEPADRAVLEEELGSRLASQEALPWWSHGCAQLADWQRQRDAYVTAHATARTGAERHPSSFGAELCRAVLGQLEQPDFQLEGMQLDGLGRRTFLVRHKNLSRLYFRAVPVDVEREVLGRSDYHLMPAWAGWREKLQQSSQGRGDAVAWHVDLPATPDFRLHKTFFSPPLDRRGLYVVLASATPDFAERDGNRVAAVNLTLSDWVLLTRTEGTSAEVTVVTGTVGEPVAGVQVELWRHNYQKGHRCHARALTDARGEASFTKLTRNQGFFVVARHGNELLVDPGTLYPYEPERAKEQSHALLYTDRSIYRPEQALHFKVVAFDGRIGEAKHRVVPSARVRVELRDANGELVAEQTVKTSPHGSASGTFTIPAGRMLGAWTLATNRNASATVRVEEYKRPTFELSWPDAEAPLRLNEPASVVGEARYYFGLPVASGVVRWRVERSTEHSGYWFWLAPPAAPERIASGETPLGADGRFEVSFLPAVDPRKAADRKVRYGFTLHVEVTDEGGETRTSHKRMRLGFSDVEAQVVAPKDLTLEASPLRLELRRTSLAGVPRPGRGRWTLLQVQQPAVPAGPGDVPDPSPPDRDPEAVELPGDPYPGRWEAAKRYRPRAIMARWDDGPELARGELEHGSDGLAAVELGPLPAGLYRLRYATDDERGQSFELAHELLVVGRTTPIGLPAMLAAESRSVPVGGTVRLFVASGTYDQVLRLDRYEGGVRVERRLLRPGEEELLELPVTAAQRGGIGFALSAVRDFQHLQLSEQIVVPWDDKQVQIELGTFRDKLRPGTRERWTVKLRSAGGRPLGPKVAELLAYMYDRSLETFARHAPPDVLALYPDRSRPTLLRASLGGERAQVITNDYLSRPIRIPWPKPDRLQFYESWGVGGPGMRALARCAPPPPPCAAPGPQMAMGMAPPAPGSAPAEVDVEASPALAAAEPVSSAPEPEPVVEEPVETRSNFAESAFFLPHLLADDDGNVTIELDVPDSVTSWSVWLHAVTTELCGASLRREVRTVKELLVRPYVPRFFREGDSAELRVVVSNAGSEPLSGRALLEVLEPESGTVVSARFGVTTPERPFTVAPGESVGVAYALTVPSGTRPIAIRATARADGQSDGELRPLPVLPSRLHLAQSRFVTLRDAESRALSFPDMAKDDDASLEHEQLVVTIDAQLFFNVLRALPYLVEFPYECCEQLLNRFVATSIVTGLMREIPAIAAMAASLPERTTPLEAFAGEDPNRRMALEETPWVVAGRGGDAGDHAIVNLLDPEASARHREQSLRKLAKAQTQSGGFPWFPGGPPSPFITLYLLDGMARAREFGVELPASLVGKAWRYLTDHFRVDIFPRMRREEIGTDTLAFLSYVLSAYDALSLEAGAFTRAERGELHDYCFARWKQISPLLKCQLALALHRAGRRADARLLVDSVMDSAKSDPELGTYWAPEDRSWLWYNDTVEGHAQVMVTLLRLVPEHPALAGLAQWLLLDKKLNHWKSTRATAGAIYALAHVMRASGTLASREAVCVQLGRERHELVFEPDRYTGRRQLVVAGPAIVPTEHSCILVAKQTRGLLFATASWHFATDRLPAEARGDFFGLERRYFRRDEQGSETTLVPLAEGAPVRLGDELEVQLSVRSKHAAEYVHLRDPRPAGCEPEDRVSAYRWQDGIGHYREIRDSGTSFFFDWLPTGELTLRYRLRASMAGTFRSHPATIQPMYAPEHVAYSAGATLTVEAAR